MSSNRWKYESNRNQQDHKISSRFDMISRKIIKNCSIERFEMKKLNYITLSYYIFLTAVISITPNAINTIQSVNGEQQMTHLSQSQNALFKDLSGPTSGKIQTLDVICGKNFMTVRAEFSGPFYGIVFSKGTYGQENCIYVKPNSGLTHAAFNVYYDQCGTKPDLQGKFYENTIVIQYGSDIIEAYDEAKRLRCEWFEAYEKPATFKPAIPVADLEVVEMNFQGDDIDCWMEIQEGLGPGSREVSKIVPVGQPMTIVVAINDYNGQFDMRVKSCVAHDGVQQPIALTDEYGCVLRPKMLTPFTKVKSPGADKKATVLSYSRFLAFKFPDSMTVQIQCTVEVCRHGCAEACQRIPSIAATNLQPELSLSARWPSQSNQPAIEGPRLPTANRIQYNAANNNQRQPEHFENFHNQHYVPNIQPPVAPSQGGGPDMGEDMSGSDSSHQPAIATQHQSIRRHEAPIQSDGIVPQYLMPANRNSFGARPAASGVIRQNTQPLSSSSSTTTTTTTSPIISSTASSQNPTTGQQESGNNRVGDDNSLDLANSSGDESQITRVSNNNDQAQQVPPKNEQDSESGTDQQQQQQQDNKAEASQVKPSVVIPEGQQQQAGANAQYQPSIDRSSASNNEQASSESSEQQLNKQQQPSVQASDEINQDNSGSSKAENEGQSSPISSSSSSSSSLPSSSSSLKTVEVEIPANEDNVHTLIASSSGGGGNTITAPQPGTFSSNRLSSVDMISNPSWAYTSTYQHLNNNQRQTYKNQQNSLPSESVIQPREPSSSSSSNVASSVGDKQRDKGEDSSIEAIIASGKSGYGTRSQMQPQINSPQIQASAEISSSQHQQHFNHQQASSADNQDSTSSASGQGEANSPVSVLSAIAAAEPTQVANKENSETGVNPDRVLIDRSDDSSSLTDTSMSSNNESPNKHEDTSSIDSSSSNSAGNDESGQGGLGSSSIDGSVGSGKVKPVVGTEELASGPIQLEDRIGSQSQESLEEALSRLQQQIPQSAALTNTKDSEIQVTREQKHAVNQASSTGNGSDKPELRADNNQQQHQQQQASSGVESQKETTSDEANQRLDLGSMLAQHNKNQAEIARAQQMHKFPDGQHESSQPFPNIAGQAKIIPDPSSNLNTRNSLLAQASNPEPLPSILPANSLQGQRSPSQPQQQLQQQQQQNSMNVGKVSMEQQQQQVQGMSSKAIAQITTVPINIGFPQSQIPAVQQQFSQQMAYFQMQQPKSTTTTTTVKPSRSRFNLLSPHAALQAVASRLLPKSVSNAANQVQQPLQAHQPQFAQQLPSHLINNIKLSPEQQKVFASQQHKFFPPIQQVQQQQQQAFPPNRFVPQMQQQQQQKALGSGIFGRLTNVQQQIQQQQQQQPQAQQPLIRSRRSAMLPTGQRGNGEVGITRTFMVVTGMDLAFSPNLTDSQLPQILEGRRMVEDDVIYGICMPIISLTFVLTCAFWLIVFIVSFCIYMLIKSRKQRSGDYNSAGNFVGNPLKESGSIVN